MQKYLLIFLLLTGLTMFSKNNANAQGVTTASINGIVADPKGPIPGATVTITHIPTGTVYSTVSRNDGRYNIPNLRVGGPYTFKVSFIGYNPFIQENITLSIGQDQRLDARIQENNTTLKEVTVTGTAGKVINSSRTGARETVNRQQIEALPTINRSLTDFAKLTPSASSSNQASNQNSFGGRSNLFNNITVDGALFNNSFGLSGTLGGQTNSQPISLDAIDQIQVDIAPYDVRQGNFTGAGVNTVVKSGTNQVKGTAYYYVRGPGLTGYKVGPTRVSETPFTYHTQGVSVGGPIIKNKLFLFVSGEQERKNEPPATNYIASRPGVSGANVSQVQASTLDAISNYLKTKYGYDPGAYENFNYLTSSDKLTAKLDWNINKNNVLSAKYFYLKSYRNLAASNSGITNTGGSPGLSVGIGTRQPGTATLPFYNSGYQINNNFNIGIIELDTRISNSMSNKLTVGYSALRDYRKSLGNQDIPMVDIDNAVTTNTGAVTTAATATSTSFGYELYTAGNLLNTNIFQFADDFSVFAGKHEFTFGTSNQIQSYTNGFAPDYNGLYTYNSASDFLNGLPAAAYTTRYSALPSGEFPYAKIKASIFSLYAQDKWHATDNLRITYGIRADYDAFPTSLDANPNAAALTFQQGIHVDVSKLPKNRVQISPRLGFNWDVNGDQSTQLRGGSGLFSGTVPFVWISNQASNNGLLFGSYTVTKNSPAAQQSQLIFNPNVNANRPAAGSAAANTSYELDVADPNLKYPKIWRTNLAIDQKLPWGIIGTIEGAYTKDINAIYHENLVLSDSYTTFNGPEGQIRYTSKNITPSASTAQSAANPQITGLYYMTNTKKGYSYFVTGQLQKSFSSGLYANIAYTHTTSKDVNDGGSTAATIWSSRAVAGNPNGDVLSNSSFVQPSRVIASIAYRKEYGKNYATSVGMIFEAANNGAISYVTSNDPNNDGNTSNDLMYIPRNQSEITLVPNGTSDTRTANQLWNQLNGFISQDKYLNTHRGQYAERNGAILPYFKRADLNITQDFFVKAGKTRNTIRLTMDIINIGNFLNRNWSTYQVSAINGLNNGNVAVLRWVGTDAATGRATYTLPYLDAANQIPPTTSYKNDTSIFSRWQMQFGVRYIFN